MQIADSLWFVYLVTVSIRWLKHEITIKYDLQNQNNNMPHYTVPNSGGGGGVGVQLEQ